MEVHVVETGVANTASVVAALERAGTRPRVAGDARTLERAERLVLPGVGTLAAARRSLDERGLTRALRQRVLAGRATLAICLGMQLLGLGSEESPGTEGLGVVPAFARAFPPGVRAPQLGWNRVSASPDCAVLRDGVFYFANSYRFEDLAADEPALAHAEHGGRFVAAFERGAVVACQFHPELSGPDGRALLQRWLRREAEPC